MLIALLELFIYSAFPAILLFLILVLCYRVPYVRCLY